MNYTTVIFGYMRFSFLGKSDARLSRHFKGEEQFDLVFNEDRMAQKFYIFENITLPSLKAQSFTDWHMDLVISKSMPQKYKARLHELVAPVPQLSVLESDAPDISSAIQPLIDSRVETPARTVHFRTDDDDALSSHLMAKLHSYMSISPENALINFPKGFLLHSDGTEVNIVRKFQNMIPICWSLVNEPGRARNPYNYKCAISWQKFPSLVMSDFAAFIETACDSSDNAQENKRKLQQARQFSPDVDSIEAQKHELNAACKRNFSWTNYDDLVSKFKSLPELPERA